MSNKDFEWVKRCIESCIHLQQLETAERLIEAYQQKWDSKAQTYEDIEDEIVNIARLEKVLAEKQRQFVS
jgi:hypothetical protein